MKPVRGQRYLALMATLLIAALNSGCWIIAATMAVSRALVGSSSAATAPNRRPSASIVPLAANRAFDLQVALNVSVSDPDGDAVTVLLEFAPGVDERPTYVGLGTTSLAPETGQIFAFFVIALAAAGAAVGLAIVLALYRVRKTIYTDEINLLKW